MPLPAKAEKSLVFSWNRRPNLVALVFITMLIFLQFDARKLEGQISSNLPESPLVQLARLSPSDLSPGDNFGSTIALSGDTLAVGAVDIQSGIGAGSVYVFEKDRGGLGNWGLTRKIDQPFNSEDGNFGWSLDLDGDVLVVGAPYEPEGAAYVYERNYGGEGAWGLVAELTPSLSLYGYGYSVAVLGDLISVTRGSYNGSFSLFRRETVDPGLWKEVQYAEPLRIPIAVIALSPNTLAFLARVSGATTTTIDFYRNTPEEPDQWTHYESLPAAGLSLACDEETSVYGTPHQGSPGYIYIYSKDAGTWSDKKTLKVSEAVGADRFGQDVAISGDLIVATSDYNYIGVAHLFQRDPVDREQWNFVQQLTAGKTIYEHYYSKVGAAVDIEQTTIVVGAPGEDNEAGAVYIFGEPDEEAPVVSVLSPQGGEYWHLADANSPTLKELVAWQMSDNIRICQVEVGLLFSTDGGLTYQEAPAGEGLPGSFGAGGACSHEERVETTSLFYTLPINPPSGTAGSLYKIRVTATDHAGNSTTAVSAYPFFIVQPNADSVKTLILTRACSH